MNDPSKPPLRSPTCEICGQETKKVDWLYVCFRCVNETDLWEEDDD